MTRLLFKWELCDKQLGAKQFETGQDTKIVPKNKKRGFKKMT